MTEDRLEKVYSADTPEKAEAAYDGWASKYDADLMAMGYRLPWMFAASVLRHIPFGTGPILDAGCGTGLQVEPLHLLGWRGFTGVDLSTEMMEVARAKGLYDDLQQVELGKDAALRDRSLRRRLLRGHDDPRPRPDRNAGRADPRDAPGGFIAYSLRHDAGQLPHYLTYPKR
jgi:predicted TPR repeat methyltransferase